MSPSLRPGVTLVESCVAVVLLSVAGLGVARGVRDSSILATTTAHRTHANALAAGQVERLRAAGEAAYLIRADSFSIDERGNRTPGGLYAVKITRAVVCVPSVNGDRASQACGAHGMPLASYVVTVAYANRTTGESDTARAHASFWVPDGVVSYVASVTPQGQVPVPLVSPPLTPTPILPEPGPALNPPPVVPQPPTPSVTIAGPMTLRYESRGDYSATISNLPNGIFFVAWSGTSQPRVAAGTTTAISNSIGAATAFGGAQYVPTSLTATVTNGFGQVVATNTVTVLQQTCGLRTSGAQNGQNVAC